MCAAYLSSYGDTGDPGGEHDYRGFLRAARRLLRLDAERFRRVLEACEGFALLARGVRESPAEFAARLERISPRHSRGLA